MVSRIVLGLMFSGMMFGQTPGQTSVFVTLFSNISAPAISNNVLNIGQSNHTVSIHYSDVPFHTCAGFNQSAYTRMEYSFDNNTFIPFGQLLKVNNPIAVTDQLYVGTGLYPFVRVHVIAFNTTNCFATVTYTGAVTGVNPSLTSCTSALSIPLTNGGTNLIKTIPNTSASFSICGIMANNNGSTTPVEISLFGGTFGGSCGGVPAPFLVLDLSTSLPTFGWGNGGGVLFNVPVGQDLCAVVSGLSGSTSSTLLLSYMIN